MDDPGLRQLQRIDVSHLQARFFPTSSETASVDYHALGGIGLERLCFHLLLAEGHSPRLFGKPGQKDYGVDLLVADGDECRVYQCKNLARFSRPKLRKALADLATGWLALAEVPRPLCTSRAISSSPNDFGAHGPCAWRCRDSRHE